MLKTSPNKSQPINNRMDSPEVLHRKNNGEIVKALLAQLILIFTDLLGVTAAFLIGYQARIHILPNLSSVFPVENPPPVNETVWWIWGIVVICFFYEKLYSRRLSFWRETKRVIGAITLSFIMIMAIVSLGKMSANVSRTVLVIAYLLSLFIIPIGRYLIKYILAQLSIWDESIVILGSGDTAQKIATAMQNDWYLGYNVTSIIDPLTYPGADPKDHSMAACIDATAAVNSKLGIRNLIIAIPDLSGTELVGIAQKLQPHVRSLWTVPDLRGIPMVGGEVESFFDEQILAFRTRNNLASRSNMIAKRLFDLVVGTLILILVTPILITLALLIKLDSPGPVIYAGTRIGRLGREFKCYKFRTMYVENGKILEEFLEKNPKIKTEWELYAKIRGEDPRVTRMGRLLRKFSLDELPQFINVLKGEMSLVGARPYLPQEKEKMAECADTILLAYPGITGLWQVSGRNELDFSQRVQIEVWYVRNWSLWLDISILFRTIPVALRASGAY
jgi:Undecaprenyl-phosphate galactose phosphotransferase WbaP